MYQEETLGSAGDCSNLHSRLSDASVTSVCGTSGASFNVTAFAQTPNRCGVFTATPYTNTTTTVTGTLSSAVANTTVGLYIDGYLFQTTMTSTTTWSISVAGELYGDAVLSFEVQETGMMPFVCPASEIVNCTPPPAFAFTPASINVGSIGQTVTFSVTGTTAGVLYALENAASPNIDIAVSVFSTGADFDIISFPFATTGIHNVQVRALTFDGPGCETIGLATVNVLKLDLLYFNAIALENENTVSLKWTTNSDDKYDFIIEKSKDGEVWKELKTIPNSNKIHYSANDENPYSGISYYRLKQINSNKESSYSEIRSVKLISKDIRIYPNPTSDIITIKGVNNEVIEIYNALGQNVSNLTKILEKNTSTTVLDLSLLNPGLYTIKSESVIKKIQKQ